SRVRSVTEIIMIAITPTPPTINPTADSMNSTYRMIMVMPLSFSRNFSWLTTAKLLSWPGRRWRRSRIASVTSSIASAVVAGGARVLHLGEGAARGNVATGDVGPRRAPPEDAHAVLGLGAERHVRLSALVQGHPAHRRQARDDLGVGNRDRRIVPPRAHLVR